MALTPEQRRENGRRGALKRWENSTAEERQTAARKMVAGRTDQTEIKKLRTRADRLGFTLVPKTQD